MQLRGRRVPGKRSGPRSRIDLPMWDPHPQAYLRSRRISSPPGKAPHTMHGSIQLVIATESDRIRQAEASPEPRGRAAEPVRRDPQPDRGAQARWSSAPLPLARCPIHGGHGRPRSRSPLCRIPPRPVIVPTRLRSPRSRLSFAAAPASPRRAPRTKEPPIGATMTGVARRLTSPTFVGRGMELAVLEVALERAATNRPSAVFVGGESGVGKTRLLQEFEAHAREQGACVLHGQCLELGGGHIPYAPLVSALRPVARDGADDLRDLPAATLEALAGLLPELGDGTRAGRARRGRAGAPARAASTRRCSRCSPGSAASSRCCSCWRTSTGRTARRATSSRSSCAARARSRSRSSSRIAPTSCTAATRSARCSPSSSAPPASSGSASSASTARRSPSSWPGSCRRSRRASSPTGSTAARRATRSTRRSCSRRARAGRAGCSRTRCATPC